MRDEAYRDLQYAKFSAYGFLKNLKFFEPFLVLFFLEKGVGYLGIGSLFAVREICVNIFEIPTGVLADGLGRRRTMILSFVAYILSFFMFYFGGRLVVFFAGMVVFALGEAFRTGTHKAMIMSYLRNHGWSDRKADYYGHTRSWSQIGSSVSAVIAAAIVFYSGRYATVFLFSTAPYVLDMLLMLTYPKGLDGNSAELSGTRVAYAFRAVFRDLGRALRTPGFLRIVTGAAVYGGFYKGAKDYLQPLVRTLALSTPILVEMGTEQRSAVFIGAVYSVLYVLTSIASRYAARLAGRLRHPERALTVELIVGLGVGAGAGAFHALGLPPVAVLLFFTVYVVQNLRRPLAVAAVSDAFAESVQATVLSVESQLQSLIAALVAFSIGAIAEAAGGRIGVGIIVVSVGLLTTVPLLTAGQTGRDRAAAG